jgi:hypothetical protein
MKNLLSILILLLLSNNLLGQKYSSKKGQVTFEASVPLFEDISAKENNNVFIFDTDTGGIASISFVKNFKFTVALMEEHFNENYAETGKYPKVTFKGKVLNFDKKKITISPQKFTIQGILNFHGADKAISSPVTIYTKDGKIYFQGSFVVKPIDFKITIPKVVNKKVAEVVKIKYDYILILQ